MKNELILASRPANPNASKTHAAQVRLKEVLSELGLQELTPRFAIDQSSVGTTQVSVGWASPTQSPT